MAPDDRSRDSEDPQTPPRPGGEPGGPTGQRFTPADRIRRRRDYEAVYERGSRLSGPLMTVFLLPNTLGVARLGIAATRKIGPAVGRNRAKRRIRELFRQGRPAESVDIVVVPRRDLITAPIDRVEAEFSGLLARHRRRRHA